MIVSNKDVKRQQREEEIMTIAINIKEIENVYAREEENYVKKLSNMFDETWQEVSLGENLISKTIELHKDGAWNPNGAQISQQLFHEVHMQIRQVYMKVLNSFNFLLLFQRACFAFRISYGRHGHLTRPSSTQTVTEKPWLCYNVDTDHIF